jgi:hypothetical protein
MNTSTEVEGFAGLQHRVEGTIHSAKDPGPKEGAGLRQTLVHRRLA